MKPERNDPCPCGSGKKYKKCCGMNAASTAIAPAVLRDQALSALQRGDFDTCAARCRQWLQAAPNDFDAHHIMGLSELQSGRLSAATAHLEKAAQLNPRNPFVLNNLAAARQGLGELAEAERCARAALVLDPHLADAHNNLGKILLGAGRTDEAVSAYRAAVVSAPGNALFHTNLGGALMLQGEPGKAEYSYRRALEVAPQSAPALAGLGAVHLAQKQWPEARTFLENALAAGNQDATVFNHLGLALRGLNDRVGAQKAFRQALVRKPDFGWAHYSLGLEFEGLGDMDSAITAYAQALQHGFQAKDAYLSLLQLAGNGFGVDLAYPHALRLLADPDLSERELPALIAYLTLACDFKAISRAWVHFDRLFSEGRITEKVLQSLLLYSNYVSCLSEETVFRYHRALGDMVSRRLTALPSPPEACRPVPGRKIKLGYLSPDFREHSVGLFIRYVLGNHNRDAFEVICYSVAGVSDAVTDSIRMQVDGFHDVRKLDDAALAGKIREDGIHILVDLAGHTADNRFNMLALKPAPVQIQYLGYPNTSGASFIDHWISDPHVHAENDALHTERLLRLPESFLCFGKFDNQALECAPPAVQNGVVTFGSFNSHAKLSEATVRLWARVLNAVPASRLRLKAQGFSGQVACRNVEALFHAHGVGRDRLVLIPLTKDRTQHLDQYREIDMALDPIPYNGTTTTCEALWMGVPVLTLVGSAHRQRVSCSILKNMGADDTIAWNEDDYVAIAARLAGDLPALSELRQRVARNIRGSILCDPPRFTRQFEVALRRAWDDYCSSNSSRSAEADH